MVNSVSRVLQAAAVAAAVMLTSQAHAATEIMWWHAMSGQLGRQLEKLASDFNASQSEYKIVPHYKGNYTETVTAAIFAFRSRSQPAIVQVNEIATATMMAARGAIYPVFELMRSEAEAFSPSAYLPAVTGYYSDVAGNMLSFPFNASTPILYYNKDMFRAAGLDPAIAPKTWPEIGAAAKRLRASGAPCGLTTSWPSWINVENFSAYHNLPISTKANGFGGLDAELNFNNPVMVRHVAQLAEWQTTKVFDYSGRAQTAEPRFQKGECGIFLGVFGDPRRHQGQFEVRGRLWHAAVLARRRGRAPKHYHRRRHPVGAARPAARRIQGRGKILRLPVEAGSPGRLAPEHRLFAGDKGGLRPDPRPGFL